MPDGDICKAYRRERNRKLSFIGIMLVLAAIMFCYTLGVGTYHITHTHALEVFWGHITGNVTDTRSDYWIWEVRVPRALCGVLSAIGLSIGGVVMQNLLRNPLAEPYTMGVSSGAMFGVTLSIGLGINLLPIAANNVQVMVNAFIFSLVPLAIILLISIFKKVTPLMMILVGIAVMYLFSSFTQVVLVTSSSETMTEIYSWNLGALSKGNWDNLPLVAGVVIVMSTLIYIMNGKLDVMYTGDRSAQSLGLRVNVLRLSVLVLTCLLTAALVCCTGTIGFVGLVSPHIARIFVGSSNKYLMPAAASFSVAFILLCDTIAKCVGTGGLPVGVFTSLVGGPLFLYILIRGRKRTWM